MPEHKEPTTLNDALACIGVPNDRVGVTFDCLTALPGAALAVLRAWAKQPKGFMFLHGATGRGKSWSAVAVLRELIDTRRFRWRDCRVVSEDRYFSRLRASMRLPVGEPGGGYDLPLDLLLDQHPRKIPLLLLDDLAATPVTPWTVEQLDTLIRDRDDAHLPTIVTSNLSPADLARQYDPRIASRISRGTLLDFDGLPDLRRTT